MVSTQASTCRIMVRSDCTALMRPNTDFVMDSSLLLCCLFDIGDLPASHLALKLDTLMHGSASASPSASLREIYGLTPREQGVAMLAARGMSDDEVAGKLYISNSTVKKHLYSAYSKMGVSNRLQLEIVVSRVLEGPFLRNDYAAADHNGLHVFVRGRKRRAFVVDNMFSGMSNFSRRHDRTCDARLAS